MRWLVLVGALLAASLPLRGVEAASLPAPRVGMEMVIVIPKGSRLAIFQQVVWHSHGGSGLVATLPHARNLRAIDGRVIQRGSADAVIESSTGRFALRYNVPWNGHSFSVTMATPASVGALLVLTPRSLVLPPVLNPFMQESGRGRIPGLPHSPIFQEWGASHIRAGTPLMMVFEEAAPRAYSHQSGTYPGAALLFQIGMVLASLGAILAALHRRPAAVSDAGIVARLAEIRARYRCGAISSDELDAEAQAAMTGQGKGVDG